MTCIASQPALDPVDLELIAQRVLKLAEIAMLEHLESLERSQVASLADAETQCPEL